MDSNSILDYSKGEEFINFVKNFKDAKMIAAITSLAQMHATYYKALRDEGVDDVSAQAMTNSVIGLLIGGALGETEESDG